MDHARTQRLQDTWRRGGGGAREHSRIPSPSQSYIPNISLSEERGHAPPAETAIVAKETIRSQPFAQAPEAIQTFRQAHAVHRNFSRQPADLLAGDGVLTQRIPVAAGYSLWAGSVGQVCCVLEYAEWHLDVRPSHAV